MNNTSKYKVVDPAVRDLVAGDFPGRQLRQLSSAYFQLLMSFLSFKGHTVTVLIVQTVAKAFLID